MQPKDLFSGSTRASLPMSGLRPAKHQFMRADHLALGCR
jgi:hypothetical protein